MKRYLSIAFVLLTSIGLISWGAIGHKTIGIIAENHLTPKAKAGIRELIGDTTLMQIASWADEVRPTPAYKHTGPWHYLEFTLGMNYQDFQNKVNSLDSNHVQAAILNAERIIKNKNKSKAERAIALKFLVHFIGDIHQPMHLSKASDRGGNDVQIQFNGRGSNLHSLWDSGLIYKEGKTFEQMAKDYDTATPAQIKQWQSASPMEWAFESYQIASKIYEDMEKNGNKPDDAYYQANIPVVQQRIQMAGIRLAGTLNELFK